MSHLASISCRCGGAIERGGDGNWCCVECGERVVSGDGGVDIERGADGSLTVRPAQNEPTSSSEPGPTRNATDE